MSGDYVAGSIGDKFARSELGYIIGYSTDRMTFYKDPVKVYTQLHPPSWGSDTPASEEIADMFMNFAMDSFSGNEFGQARMEWMETNVSGLIMALKQ